MHLQICYSRKGGYLYTKIKVNGQGVQSLQIKRDLRGGAFRSNSESQSPFVQNVLSGWPAVVGLTLLGTGVSLPLAVVERG